MGRAGRVPAGPGATCPARRSSTRSWRWRSSGSPWTAARSRPAWWTTTVRRPADPRAPVPRATSQRPHWPSSLSGQGRGRGPPPTPRLTVWATPPRDSHLAPRHCSPWPGCQRRGEMPGRGVGLAGLRAGAGREATPLPPAPRLQPHVGGDAGVHGAHAGAGPRALPRLGPRPHREGLHWPEDAGPQQHDARWARGPAESSVPAGQPRGPWQGGASAGGGPRPWALCVQGGVSGGRAPRKGRRSLWARALLGGFLEAEESPGPGLWVMLRALRPLSSVGGWGEP